MNQSTPSLLRTATAASAANTTTKRDNDDDTSVTPSNLKRNLTNASITSRPPTSSPTLSSTPGYRAAEAFVRPAPITVAGTITHYVFDLRKCEFSLTLQAPKMAEDGAPTVVFLPEYHFPKDSCTVEVSSGKWEISEDEEEVALLQRLRWWHGDGEQTLRVRGVVKTQSVDGQGGGEEVGYYEAFNQAAFGSCAVM